MKKSALLFGLITITSLFIAGCNNSKDYTMTFDQAYDIVGRSILQDILINSDNFQQTLDLSTNFDDWTNKTDITLQSNSKQNLDSNKSESSTKFGVSINADNSNVIINWILDIKLLNNTIYLNLESLDISWPEDVSLLTTMIWEFKNQWYSIPMEWFSNMPNTFSYIKDAKILDSQTKEIIINEWSTIYSGKFSRFNGYNARKFSLNNEKLQQLINDYYANFNEFFTGDEIMKSPELNIQNFEWYFIITSKDKVVTVVENMDTVEWETNININGFWGDNYEINASSNWESLFTIKAIKRGPSYNISINVTNLILLEWIISPKISSSKINIKFDAYLTIKSDYEQVDDTIIPLKGRRTFNSIPDFEVIAPENSQNLTDIISSYLWNTLWWNGYIEDTENKLDNEIFTWMTSAS